MLNARVPVIVYVVAARRVGGVGGRLHHDGRPRRRDGAGHQHRRGLADLGDRRRRRARRGRTSARTSRAEKAEKFTAAFIESIAQASASATSSGRRRRCARPRRSPPDEALKLHVIDLMAADARRRCSRKLEGRKVEIEGETRTLALEGRRGARASQMTLDDAPVRLPGQPRHRRAAADGRPARPLHRVQHAGADRARRRSARVCLVLAGIAFQILPFSWVGPAAAAARARA